MFSFFGKKNEQIERKEPEIKEIKRRIYHRAPRRNFNSAQTTRLNSTWGTQPIPINNVLRKDLRTLKARSREQSINNDYARRFLQITVSNVIGPRGFILQAQSENQNGELDKAANEAIEKAFKRWAKKKNCHYEQELTFLEIQKLMMREICRDGEFIAQKIIGKGAFGFQIKLLDSELLDVNYNIKKSDGSYISMGVEFNAQNQKVAYHFLTDDRSQECYSYYGRDYVRIPANQIYHYFISEHVNQVRGIPWMSSALKRMKDLEGYEEAAIVASRAGASKMAFLTSAVDQDSNYTGDEKDEQGNIISDFEAGTIEKLPPGMAMQPFDPSYPHQQFGEFVKACLRGISGGLGVNYNTLANDLEGVNFSSIRHATLEDRELWKEIQQWFIEQPMTDIYEDWLTYALLSGKITIKNKPLKVLNEERYQDVIFLARRWEWIEPLKDTQAKELQVKNRMTSLTRIIRDRGDDPEAVFNEIKSDNELLKSMGLEINYAEGNQGNNQQTQPNQADEAVQSDQGEDQ